MIPFSLSHGSSFSPWSNSRTGYQKQRDFNWKGNGEESDWQFRRAQQDRYNEIRFKTMVLGRISWLKKGEDVSKWMSSIRYAIEFLGLTELEARFYLLSHVHDLTLRSYVEQVMREYPSAPLDELVVHLQIYLGAKSRAQVLAESRKMQRNDRETVPAFSLRVRDIWEKTRL